MDSEIAFGIERLGTKGFVLSLNWQQDSCEFLCEKTVKIQKEFPGLRGFFLDSFYVLQRCKI